MQMKSERLENSCFLRKIWYDNYNINNCVKYIEYSFLLRQFYAYQFYFLNYIYTQFCVNNNHWMGRNSCL